jgi:hypothetical protein
MINKQISKAISKTRMFNSPAHTPQLGGCGGAQ